MKALLWHDWVCCPTRHKWSCASCSVWLSHKGILFRNLNRCNRRCISGDLLLWAIGNERKQSFLSGFLQRKRFCAGSQVFLWIRRQCSTFWMLNQRILETLICLGTLDHVLFFSCCPHFLVFSMDVRPRSLGSRSFDFHTPAQSLSTNNFVNFLRSEEPPVWTGRDLLTHTI